MENVKPNDLISCCGSDCGACYCYGNLCRGCNAERGKVFHAGGQECRIYRCCRTEHDFPFCGECGKLPCDLILGTRDPNMTDEEFEKSVSERVKRLKG